jgi:hypothetical protein
VQTWFLFGERLNSQTACERRGGRNIHS